MISPIYRFWIKYNKYFIKPQIKYSILSLVEENSICIKTVFVAKKFGYICYCVKQ